MESNLDRVETSGSPPEGDVGYGVTARASLQEGRTRTLKHGDTFGVFDFNGDIHAAPGGAEGLFHRDTRHLSELTLSLNGVRPLLLSSTLRDDNATLTCDLTNPDLYLDGGRRILEHDLIHIRRSRFLWQNSCYERLAVRNYADRPVSVEIDIGFDADFTDLFEVRGTRRSQHGRRHPPRINPDSVTLAYTGLDGIERQTHLLFDPQPQELSASSARYTFRLGPCETRSIFVTIGCMGAAGSGTFFSAIREARRALRKSSSRAASIVTSNEVFNESLRRSVSDLYMLITDTPHGPYPYAGVPWFSTAFGRDALITAFETLWLDPAIAKGVLYHLAAHQATEVDPAADAEPGKILHEVRYGEMAELGEVPFRRYYGSIDSTPLFVMLAGAYLDRTGDIDAIRTLLPHLRAALSWIDEFGDRDGDGYIEYGRQTDKGLANQGWKDSHDSVFHADGNLAAGPIALCEVQAYVYGAFRAAQAIATCLGHADEALRYERRADILQAAFNRDFFDPELGTFVLALDKDKRACRVKTSNAGHALWTGIASPVHAPEVVATLMSRSSFSGWGVRTLAAGQNRYNPMSYHNGSVWPHDNALIAGGVARYGFKDVAARILDGLFAASSYIDLRRLPELFCGFSRLVSQGPTFYPVACIPQAWAAAAPLYTLQCSLGLRFDVGARQIELERPVLPDFLNSVHLSRLRLMDATVDISLHRSGHSVVVEVTDRQGNIGVITKT
ncbi:glycogen debranching N-terminal domain-containing protein [Pelagibacterium halotolerans]|uniref:amylo-alpha-1,6-glucosidase n=1 Tax=Pelagibacterium halotolerans TaxID=531813 RepID=UPI00384B1B4B